jgi:hypothetical protein
MEGFEAPKLDQSLQNQRGQRMAVFVFVLILVLLIVAGIFAVSYLLQPDAPTETLRDIFIILLTFEFMLLGFALVILLIQLARLINLLQNEIQPILESTSEAANTLRGTADFLSRNLVSPVLRVNSTIAAIRRAADMLNFGRRK